MSVSRFAIEKPAEKSIKSFVLKKIANRKPTRRSYKALKYLNFSNHLKIDNFSGFWWRKQATGGIGWGVNTRRSMNSARRRIKEKKKLSVRNNSITKWEGVSMSSVWCSKHFELRRYRRMVNVSGACMHAFHPLRRLRFKFANVRAFTAKKHEL